MALLDVSELMTDSDFVDPFTIVRRTGYDENTYGETVFTEVLVSAVGSVQATSGDTAKRLPDGVQLNGVRSIFTKAVINANTAGNYIDQIIWKNNRYNVIFVLPWENFGAGWFEVVVEIERKSV